MKRRHYSRKIELQQNWDSFLDVLTNTVGVLIFICLFTSLVAAESTSIIRTPLENQTDKEAIFFECKSERIRSLENQKVSEEISDFLESLPEVNTRNLDRFLTKMNQFSVKTDHYQVSRSMQYSYLYDDYVIQTNYKPLQDISGETSQQLGQPNSEFQKKLESYDPQSEYLAFLVREDCFQAFRRARDIAWKRNFNVGWEPVATPEDIVFTSQGGRSIGVQ